MKAYLDRADAIVLPVGTTEVHGPHLPYGTDKLIAQAGAVLVAEKTDALVAPAFSYTWSGATRSLPGTLSLPVETVIPLVRQLCLSFIEQGFYNDASQHVPKPDSANAALGRRYLKAATDAVAAALQALKTYGPEAEKQAFAWCRLER